MVIHTPYQVTGDSTPYKGAKVIHTLTSYEGNIYTLLELETTSKMEEDLNCLKMEDNLNFKVNRRKPTFTFKVKRKNLHVLFCHPKFF